MSPGRAVLDGERRGTYSSGRAMPYAWTRRPIEMSQRQAIPVRIVCTARETLVLLIAFFAMSSMCPT
jgi:hypothetical protein